MKPLRSIQLRRSLGFTLIELLVTLTIVAIVAFIATPALQAFVANNRLSATTNALLSDLQAARSEAGARGRAVSVCPRQSPTTSTPCGGNWASGRLIFVESNTGAALGAFNTGDTLLRETGAAATTNTIRTIPATGALTFQPSGQLITAGDSIQLLVCDPRGDANVARVVTVLRTGRSSVSRASAAGLTCP